MDRACKVLVTNCLAHVRISKSGRDGAPLFSCVPTAPSPSQNATVGMKRSWKRLSGAAHISCHQRRAVGKHVLVDMGAIRWWHQLLCHLSSQKQGKATYMELLSRIIAVRSIRAIESRHRTHCVKREEPVIIACVPF